MAVRTLRTSLRMLMILAPVLAIMTTAAGPATATAPATAGAARICLPVHLTGAGQDLGPNPQGQLHTTGTVFLLGWPVATTNATFTPSGPPADNILAFAGPIVFTSKFSRATFTANVRGTVDVSTGDTGGTFQATSTSVTGTGLLSGISGSLTFRGVENTTTGAFTETVTGRLCSPVRPY